MRNLSMVVCLLILTGHSLVAAAWQNIGPSPPAIEAPVAVDAASGTIYIGTFGGGVLKSCDHGRTFSAANEGLSSLAFAITSMAIDPANHDVVVIGSGD